jgi:WD40 repeat protein
MFAAQQAFENGNLGHARDLLKAQWPKPGEPDLRGFEWRYLWNLCRGDNFHTFPGHSAAVQCVAFSADGQMLASGGKDASVRLWDVAGRRLVATLSAHSESLAWLAFSNDGQTLATAGDDGLKLWNVNTRRLITTLEETNIARIAFSPVGTRLAISFGGAIHAEQPGGPIELWDYVTHQILKTFPETGSRLAFSPDGKILAARSDNDSVKLWNVETGEEVRRLNNAGNVHCLTFSPDGKSLASGNWAGEVRLWKVATGKEASKLAGHGSVVWAVAFAPNGGTLASASADQSVRLWNVATGKEEAKLIGHGSDVKTMAFTPDGGTLATGGKDEKVMLWRTASKRPEDLISNVQLPPSFSQDNRLLVTAKLGGPVTVWDVSTRQPVWVLHSEEFSQFPKEGVTLSTVSTNHILRFWDVATQTLQREVPLPGIARASRRVPVNLDSSVVDYAQFLFALGGSRLAAADAEAIITLQDTTTGGVIGRFKPHNFGIAWPFMEGMKFSPDARLLATAGAQEEAVKLWDVETQKEVGGLSGHKESAQGLAFSPDGSLLASASFDGSVRFLRIATGKVEPPLTGIKEGCSGVAFAQDGRTLAVACDDGTVRLWHLPTRREVAVLRHGKVPVRFVVFSSDGQTLVSVCEKGTMRFWDAPSPANF